MNVLDITALAMRCGFKLKRPEGEGRYKRSAHAPAPEVIRLCHMVADHERNRIANETVQKLNSMRTAGEIDDATFSKFTLMVFDVINSHSKDS